MTNKDLAVVWLWITTAIYIGFHFAFPYVALLIYVAVSSPAAWSLLSNWTEDIAALLPLDLTKLK